MDTNQINSILDGLKGTTSLTVALISVMVIFLRKNGVGPAVW